MLSKEEALTFLALNLCCWGLWPTLRTLCGAEVHVTLSHTEDSICKSLPDGQVAAFAALNMTFQLIGAFSYHTFLGGFPVADVFTDLVELETRAWAVFIGGFLLGPFATLSFEPGTMNPQP